MIRILLSVGLLLAATAARADHVTLTDGTTHEAVHVLGWTRDYLLVRKGEVVTAIPRATVKAVMPNEPWGEARLRDARVAGQGAPAGKAVPAFEEALSHAPTGKVRNQLVADLALALQAQDRLAEAWAVTQECPNNPVVSPIVAGLRARAKARIEALRQGMGNVVQARHGRLWEIAPLTAIEGAGMTPREVSDELLRVALDHRSGAQVTEAGQACSSCGGLTVVNCARCRGGGRACRPCRGVGRIVCAACYRTGVARNSFPDSLRTRLRDFTSGLKGKIALMRRRRETVKLERLIPALILKYQFFIPSWFQPPLNAQNEPMKLTLQHGHTLDDWCTVLPLRRNGWPSGRFSAAGAAYIDALALAADADKQTRRWQLIVTTVHGLDPTKAPLQLTRLRTDLPMDVVAHTEDGYRALQTALGPMVRDAGSVGSQIKAWIAAYPFRAVNEQLKTVTPGSLCAIFGRVQAPGEGRFDRRPAFEVWSVTPLGK